VNVIAWLLYFLVMPVWAFATLFFKIYFSLVYRVLKLIVNACLLIAKSVKIGITYMIRKVKEYRQ
jgi:hypothetical protein